MNTRETVDTVRRQSARFATYPGGRDDALNVILRALSEPTRFDADYRRAPCFLNTNNVDLLGELYEGA